MKLLITVLENNPNIVLVKNKTENDYTVLDIKSGEEKEIRTGIAKIFLGDWEDESWGEKQRQISNNIHLLDIEIQTKPAQISIGDKNDKQIHAKQEKEPEFADLEVEKEIEEKEEVVEKCQAKTKAGKRCKQVALKGSKFCGLHQKG